MPIRLHKGQDSNPIYGSLSCVESLFSELFVWPQLSHSLEGSKQLSSNRRGVGLCSILSMTNPCSLREGLKGGRSPHSFHRLPMECQRGAIAPRVRGV